MSESATPAEEVKTPPAATPEKPPEGKGTSDETVTMTKAEAEQLQRDAARAPGAQQKADRYETILKKHGLLDSTGHFKPAKPAQQATPEEQQAAGADEDRKAERGLLNIAVDPEFRAVFDADPTLRDLMTKNPLAVLPMLAPDALDADDAMGLVKESLRKRIPTKKEEKPPVTTPETPPTGGVNVKDNLPDENVEKARKLPNTENAIAGMIGARIGLHKK